MEQLKQVVFTLCVASLCGGVMLHLFPDATAKRCMKAVAGLYILSAVLGSLQDGKVVLSALQEELQHVPTLQTQNDTFVSSDMTAQNVDFETALLSQTEASLNTQYNDYLQSQGYDATVSIELMEKSDRVFVERASVYSTNALSTETQQILTDYFCDALALNEIVFIDQ